MKEIITGLIKNFFIIVGASILTVIGAFGYCAFFMWLASNCNY